MIQEWGFPESQLLKFLGEARNPDFKVLATNLNVFVLVNLCKKILHMSNSEDIWGWFFSHCCEFATLFLVFEKQRLGMR